MVTSHGAAMKIIRPLASSGYQFILIPVTLSN